VVWTPDGKSIASGSVDSTIKVWNAQTGQCVSTLNVDSGSVNSVAFCPDGSKIAAAHSHEIQLFDAQTQAKLGSPLTGHSEYVTAVSYSCLFSNMWCVLTIEHFTAESRVFPSAQTAQNWPVAAGTTALEFGRRRLARACRR
jgi:WD40 repeat protein